MNATKPPSHTPPCQAIWTPLVLRSDIEAKRAEEARRLAKELLS
jgi:hypothetical protein